ncbi:hypothetical protein [Mycobacterium sp. PSTR-4-N]|uniref:hypothetical protein n=1 Tax=Mycobacterium sp. PSTR-4-N TaxID=2917745 RepID=UPI001F15330F|nr:hypothetical protein [Mycobacterium sp. PSTR-4-N]MCG7592433.1 hypothetical protein [Mycobacterium sp. PSTR-4-N]
MTVRNPLTDDDAEPMGEYPCLPAKSGVAAILAAADKATQRITDHEAFVRDLWQFCEGKHVIGVVEIRNLMASHHV